MDAETEAAERERREARRRRSITYCLNCGHTYDRELPHLLGLPLIVLQCNTCGMERVFVKTGERTYKRPGPSRRRKPSL